jgi:hypothetical protein
MRITFIHLTLLWLGILFSSNSNAFGQHSIGISYQYPYTNDTYAIEYFHTFRERWQWSAGLKFLGGRKLNFNDERAFYRSRQADHWTQIPGLTTAIYYRWSPENWGIKSYVGLSGQFTYTALSFNYTENTGVVLYDEYNEVIYHTLKGQYKAFPTVENHLLLRVEAPISKRLILQLAVGGGTATSWNWDPALENFRYTEGFDRCCVVPAGNRKVLVEFTPCYTMGLSWMF